ncbi:MAG: hypothetical protein DBX48_08765 [Limosilactobacillus fermentum]|nr:MAG: hypothetical protein DBX48_08765 [Limosilactobacillus fermentum]
MEKYTKEGLVDLSHEELESAVLELQRKVEMYKGFWDDERVKYEKVEQKIQTMSMLLQSWK